jgi:2-oxoisovalerate ferredoxin oxidoreductase beta subunit
MRMAEIIAQMEAPVYVERVALYDAKQRVRAQKAIRKGLQIQAENKGFSFVEVLAECPTHLKLTPLETEKWVRECMVPVFPLGVKKDAVPETWGEWRKPSFDVDTVLKAVGAVGEAAPRFCRGFPKTPFGKDIALKLAGSGGDGAQTAAMLITRAAISEGFDATHIPSYGPESRGGTSYADVRVAEEEVLSPAAPHPHVLMAFNAPSLTKFAPAVEPGGLAIYDSSVITDPPTVDSSVRLLGVPFTGIAHELGKPMVKNIVALGALLGATGLFPEETFLTAIRHALKDKGGMVALNEEAFARGLRAVGNGQAGSGTWFGWWQ